MDTTTRLIFAGIQTRLLLSDASGTKSVAPAELATIVRDAVADAERVDEDISNAAKQSGSLRTCALCEGTGVVGDPPVESSICPDCGGNGAM